MKLGPYLLGPNDTPENGIYTGDARELCEALPMGSVDMIFTDPPYDRKSLHLFDWTARAAVRTLRWGKFVLSMTGGMYLNRAMAAFDTAGLDFYWLYNIYLRGNRTGIAWVRGNTQVPVVCRLKPVIAYSNGPGYPRCSTVDFIAGMGPDKRYHKWGQEVAPIRYYIDCFSADGDVIFDPFCGGGTVAEACLLLGRRYLCFELDPVVAETARQRLRMMQPMLPLFVPEPVQGELML